ncbi:MAG: helix-turn-helix domain-containing protein, partial [Muribaculaceae bacterium]|nr:helix-turn-helix domain-containing protein [Muribaculaceae bacterium]
VKKAFTSHRDVGHYASALHLSPGHLSRIVKNVSGKTVSEWIKDYVILEAKVMLRSKDLAIYEISDMLSFPNPSFFSKYFRERVGITPTQYRDSE